MAAMPGSHPVSRPLPEMGGMRPAPGMTEAFELSRSPETPRRDMQTDDEAVADAKKPSENTVGVNAVRTLADGQMPLNRESFTVLLEPDMNMA